jgi:hypothetical protein
VSSPVDPPQARGVVGKSASSGDGATSSWRNDGSEIVGASFTAGNGACPRSKNLSGLGVRSQQIEPAGRDLGQTNGVIRPISEGRSGPV